MTDTGLNIEQHGLRLAKDTQKGPLVIPGKIEEYGLYLVTNDELNILGQNVEITRVPNTVRNTNNRAAPVVPEDYINTIYDSRLGSSNYHKVCGNNTKFYYPQFISDIVKILVSVCNDCGYSLITENQIQINKFSSLYGRKRLRAIAKFISGMKSSPSCPSGNDSNENRSHGNPCSPNLPFDMDGSKKNMVISRKIITNTKGTGKASGTTTMSSKEVYEILDKIRVEHARWLGFEESHPRDMLFDKLIVVPPCTRTGTFVKDVYENNKIDTIYNEIIKTNNELKVILNTRKKNDSVVISSDASKFFYLKLTDILCLLHRNGIIQDISETISGYDEILKNCASTNPANQKWPDNFSGKMLSIGKSFKDLRSIFSRDETTITLSYSELCRYNSVMSSNYNDLDKIRNDDQRFKNNADFIELVNYVHSVKQAMIDSMKQAETTSSTVKIGDIEPKIRDIQQAIRRLMIDVNQTVGQAGKNVKAVKSLLAMLKGKKGLFRYYLLGKRVGGSARGVIRNDPDLTFGSVAVPNIFAPNLTLIIGVTIFNKHIVDKLWDNGRISFIQYRSQGFILKRVDPNMIKTGARPRVGDKVYRWIQNGDVLIANRQPTLHKQGFMGQIVQMTDGKSIGIPISVTLSYNADFDGDEMNLHVPQTAISQLETILLASAINCIVSEQDSDPINAPSFDSPASMYQMTNPIVQQSPDGFNFVAPRMVTPEKYDHYTAGLTNDDSMLHLSERLQLNGVNRFSGPALFSRTLPYDFSYKKGRVIIRDGILVSGTITKSDIGAKRGGIVKILFHEPKYGPKRAATFIDDVTYLSRVWNADYSLTMGAKDCFPDDPAYKQALREVHNRTIERSTKIMKRQGQSRSKIEKKRLERELVSAMDAKKELTEVIDTYLDPEHAFRVASESGSKGSAHNLIACVTGGRVIQLGGKLYSETATERIPYHPINTEGLFSPIYRGLVLTSLAKGSTRENEYNIAQAGREGMVATGITIQKTGAQNRNMRHFTQNLVIDNNGSVVDIQNGMIVSLIYGNDGLNPKYLTAMNVSKMNINSTEMLVPIDLYRLANNINRQFGFADDLN